VSDVFHQVYAGVRWPDKATRKRAYIRLYQRVKKDKVNAKRRRSYHKLQFDTRRRDVLRSLNTGLVKQPRATTVTKYGLRWDKEAARWTCEAPLT
jgi:hypothetical protein